MKFKEAFVVQWLSSLEMDTVIQVRNLKEAVCFSHSANTLGKDMHPIMLTFPVMGK